MTNAEIQEGEYVRTKEGYIAKCIKKSGYVLSFDNTARTSYGEPWDYLFPEDNEILRHSFNIIDLIEAGDYVNGDKVELSRDIALYVTHNYLGGIGVRTLESYYTYVQDMKEEDIETIVTREQFKSMEYEVGKDDK